MKRICQILLLFALVLTASAKKIDVRGIKYDLDSKTGQAKVLNIEPMTDVYIPDFIVNPRDKKKTKYEVIFIEDNAFKNKGIINSLSLPKSLMSICVSNDFFAPMKALQEVTLPECVGPYSQSFASLIDKPTLREIKLSSSFAEIPERFISFNTHITKVTFPRNLKSIGKTAFKGCSNLKEVEFPAKLTSIGESAFENCTQLTAVTIPSGVVNIGGSAFKGCSRLKSVELPQELHSIGESAFENCRQLSTMVMPIILSSIPAHCFSNCESLTTIQIPEGLESLGAYAFGGCSSLTSISLPNCLSSIGEGALSKCRSLTSISIPATLQSMPNKLLQGCSGLQTVTLPDGLTSVGSSAFEGCQNLSKITLPEKVAAIGSGAFAYCSNLMEVNIPQGVTSLSSNLFLGCAALSPKMVIPEGVTSIEDYCFKQSGVEEITLPLSLNYVSANAFNGCSVAVTLPSSLTTLPFYISSLEWVESLSLPVGISSIPDGTFSQWQNLRYLRVGGGLESYDGLIGANASFERLRIEGKTFDEWYSENSITDLLGEGVSPSYSIEFDDRTITASEQGEYLALEKQQKQKELAAEAYKNYNGNVVYTGIKTGIFYGYRFIEVSWYGENDADNIEYAEMTVKIYTRRGKLLYKGSGEFSSSWFSGAEKHADTRIFNWLNPIPNFDYRNRDLPLKFEVVHKAKVLPDYPMKVIGRWKGEMK